MATVRYYQKCDVCGEITLVRLQVAAWLHQHPVYIYCGNCLTLMTGVATYDHENIDVSFELDNSSRVGMRTHKYQWDVSGELLTPKASKYNPDNPESVFTPFFRGGIFTMQHEGVQEFQKRIGHFVFNLRSQWHVVRRIQELWQNKKYDYLKTELLKFVPNKNIKLRLDVDFFMGTHQSLIWFLSPIIKNSGFFNKTDEINKKLKTLLNGKEYLDFIDYIKRMGLQRKEEKVFERIKAFVKIFPELIPALGVENYVEKPNYQELGITTTTFEDLKTFYQDTYEVVTELLELIVGTNNLYHRGSYEFMRKKRDDISQITEYSSRLSKGQRLEYIDGQECFDFLIRGLVDHEIRNAIGHVTYRYDVMDQVIKYYPKANESGGKANTIYLAEFAQKCLNIFYALINTFELLYQLRKNILLKKALEMGEIPSFVNALLPEEKKPKLRHKDTFSNKKKQQKASRKKNR